MGSDSALLDVSCILVNYNSARFTIDCITSIINNTQDSLKYEIVIIDNSSKLEDYTVLKKAVNKIIAPPPPIKLYRSNINTGFGGGNMDGVKLASQAKYYAFINNDTLLNSEKCLASLMDFMLKHPNVGACGPQMLNEHKQAMVSIGHFASPLTQIISTSLLEKILPNKYPKRKAKYTEPIKVNYIQGAFMFIDAKAFNHIGGFDNNLFIYYEESDVCRRLLKKLDKTTYLVPDCDYIHFEGQSINRKKRNIAIKAEQKIALIYYIKKHFSFLEYKLLLTFLTVKYFFSALVKTSNWNIFILLIQGAPLSKSLKQKQTIIPF